jgi:hypothetical protein
MTDDLSNRGPQDRTRINVHEEHELAYWSDALGISRDELRRLVDDVGPIAEDVKRQVGKADAR